jgi:ABC-2 type transport system ATP-binding protein
LRVARGQVFGLVGENGAGKTTLIQHFLGGYRAEAGSVRVFDIDPVYDPTAVLSRIGYLSEDRDLPLWMRVGELMRYTQAFYPKWDEAYAQRLREEFGLTASARIKTLSRGEKAKMGLLIALAHRPDLLLLDEPSSGLDAVARQDLLAAVVRSVAEEGRTVVFSSHLLDEVERVADRVALVHDGRIVLCDSLEHIKLAHRRFTVRFAQPQYSPPKFNGALGCTGEGLEWTFLANGGSEELQQAVAEHGGTIVEEVAPTLEEIFVSRMK